MTTKDLLQILNTRIKSNDGNPTSESFLYSLVEALQKLDAYEEKENQKEY